MAAYAALASLLNDLELIPNHATHSFSFDNQQISSLSQTVETLIDFVETYDSHGCSTEAAQVLESRIATAAHAAHDVIESHIVDQIHAGSTRGGKVRSYFLLDLERAIDSMEFVKRKAMQFKARGGSKAEQTTYSSPAAAAAAATTSSAEPLKSSGMVGFDEAVVRLMDILAGPSNQRLVVPVAGMGGLGKTSLAKTVYEHSYVRDHFDVRLWATISHEYSAETILTQLLYGENKSTTGGDVNELGEVLHKRLYGRRYLIVLDDIWSDEAWDKVQRFLPDNGNGSRVVVTTRLSDLAAHLSSSPFKLNFLDEDKSWELFCAKTFGEEDCPAELEEIGKRIAKRCRGLPLSIVVMGGHLRRSSRSIEYWEKVANYMNPISSIGEEEQCLEILRLSYQHLPACLKPCFLYLGIYKEDESIDASRLLRQWIDEGFLRVQKELSLEEVGENYLKDLIDRNLILVVSRRWNGKAKYCRIHDSVREVCLKVCKKEKFLCEVYNDDSSTQVIGCRERHIVIPKGKNFNSHTIGAKQLSALQLPLFDCSLLRVLLRNIQINRDGTCLPSAHFQPVNSHALVFDQYLHAGIYSILTSLPACWNLQTLHMMYYSSSRRYPMTLPYEIWEMPQLRILQAIAVFLTDPAPAEGSDQQEEGIVLQNLHTLEGVVNLRLTEEVCKRMPNLKKLKVRYDCFCDDYCIQNLGRFNKLKWLWIEFDDDSKWCDAVPTLTLPTSLEELELRKCHLGWEDLTRMISSPLPHLGNLQVSSVRGSEWNLDEEVFCCLKWLQIWNCVDLIHWNANSSHFPVLEFLSLIRIPELSEIPLDIGDIPTLRLISLIGCSASASISAVRMVMKQETDYENYDIQLRVELWNREEFGRFQEMLKEEEECLTSGNIQIYYDGDRIKTL